MRGSQRHAIDENYDDVYMYLTNMHPDERDVLVTPYHSIPMPCIS